MKDSVHIDFVEKHGAAFSERLGLQIPFQELLKLHGAKVYQHAFKWKKEHIPFRYAVMIYLACHHHPFLDKFDSPAPRDLNNYERVVPAIYLTRPRGVVATVEYLLKSFDK